jgi:hypothetical protein
VYTWTIFITKYFLEQNKIKSGKEYLRCVNFNKDKAKIKIKMNKDKMNKIKIKIKIKIIR